MSSKKFRLISYVNPIPSLLQGQFVIEEVLNEEHDHEVEGIPLRGLSREQKGIVLFCEERKASNCVPDFQPVAYLSDRASAFANAA